MTNIKVRVIDCHITHLQDGEPKFLMLKRSPQIMYGGIWQCVTGKIESTEKPIQTAVRELKEETGLSPINKWTVDQVNHFYEAEFDRMNLIPVFGVEVGSLTIKLSDEHCDYKWCELDEAIPLFTWTQQKNGLLAFYEMLTSRTEKLNFSKII
ncbi:MAG: NUDIX pyrophosphatase [Candidatus Marinimicrobia bacterium]|nr:NUDIX pyrophosphatase [Candidatus Neomarinimicrobiota bacterium]